jgi:hypothetical protein
MVECLLRLRSKDGTGERGYFVSSWEILTLIKDVAFARRRQGTKFLDIPAGRISLGVRGGFWDDEFQRARGQADKLGRRDSR